VLDTPVHNGPNYGVCGNNPAFLGQFGGTSTNYSTPYNFPGCDPANPDGEMFSNYMDYSSDVCQNTFTLGQKDRMDFTLHGDGTGPGIRSYLISAENLELTGVADPYTQPDCAPISLFYFQQSGGFATQQMICAGESVNFEESVYNGTVDNYLWTFEGGNPATDTDPSPNVIYDNPGTYDVSLQVSNTAGSNTRTENDMVIVSSNTAQFQNDWGYVDSFYGESGFLSNYVVFNRDNSVNKWEWFTGLDGGSTGSESVRMVNLDNQTSEVDELISPSYDLSTVSNATLKFRYSGAAVDNTPSDELRIMASDDCGETWSLRETISGFDLCNAGLVNQSYVPNSQSPWMDFDVSLGSFSNNNNVRIKFRWISGGRSNNFYIDDITLSASPLGMEDLEQMIGLSIAPNPTSDMTSISLDLVDGSDVTMEVVDVLGRSVRSILSRELSSGNHRVDLDMSKFNVGIYYLRITVGNNLIVKKIVRN
jgi:PKD repeat protein